LLRLAGRRSAAYLLSGASCLDGGKVKFNARLTETATEDLTYAFEPVVSPRTEPAAAIDTLAERLVAAVATHLLDGVDISLMVPPSNYEAYQAFQLGADALHEHALEAREHLRRAVERDRGFHIARAMAVTACLKTGDLEQALEDLSVLDEQSDQMTPFEKVQLDYMHAMVEGEHGRMLVANRRMLEMAPNLSWVRFECAKELLFVNRPHEATEILEPILDSYLPDDYSAASWPLEFMTIAQHMVGNYERELEYADRGLGRFPDVVSMYLAKVKALAAMGRTEELYRVVEEVARTQTRFGSAGMVMARAALELRAHGFPEAGNAMATRSVEWFEEHPSVAEESQDERNAYYFMSVLFTTGRLDRLENFIDERKPSGGVMFRGWIAARRGHRDEAMQIRDEQATEKLPPFIRSWWRASVAAQIGDKDRAVKLLAEAFANGLEHDSSYHSNPGLEPLWGYPPFQELLRPKG